MSQPNDFRVAGSDPIITRCDDCRIPIHYRWTYWTDQTTKLDYCRPCFEHRAEIELALVRVPSPLERRP